MIEIREGLEVYRGRPAKASWKVPAFCCNDWIAIRTLQLCEEIGIEKPFDIVYGAPRCAWAGGRPSVISSELTDDQLHLYFGMYREHGVRVALTLSRLVVDLDAYQDAYCNRILDIANQYGSEIILFNHGLADYIRSEYLELRLICSLNRPMSDFKTGFEGMDETAYYRKLLERYDELVIRWEFAQEDENLESLSDVADRCEIIVNQFCMPNCKNVFRHVSSMENWDHEASIQQCYSMHEAADITKRLCSNLRFSNKRIDRFMELGFVKMKLAGRNAPPQRFLEMLSNYIFEPTGMFQFVKEELSREYQTTRAQMGGKPLPFWLPEELELKR